MRKAPASEKERLFSLSVSGSGLEDKALLQTALVVDISQGGLQISIPSTYKFKKEGDGEASRMTIIFALPGSKNPLSIQCVPQRTFRSNVETRIGASLVDTDVETYQAIQNYLVNSISA